MSKICFWCTSKNEKLPRYISHRSGRYVSKCIYNFVTALFVPSWRKSALSSIQLRHENWVMENAANAYLLAKIGADTAGNEQHSAENSNSDNTVRRGRKALQLPASRGPSGASSTSSVFFSRRRGGRGGHLMKLVQTRSLRELPLTTRASFLLTLKVIKKFLPKLMPKIWKKIAKKMARGRLS